MQKTLVGLLIIAAACSQRVLAAEPTTVDLNNSPVVEHQTTIGNVMCQNPQYEFDASKFQSNKFWRSHMLVDILTQKIFLGKSRAELRQLFAVTDKRDDIRGESQRFQVNPSSGRCGNTPASFLECIFDKDDKLVRYRARYYEDATNSIPVDSAWVE